MLVKLMLRLTQRSPRRRRHSAALTNQPVRQRLRRTVGGGSARCSPSGAAGGRTLRRSQGGKHIGVNAFRARQLVHPAHRIDSQSPKALAGSLRTAAYCGPGVDRCAPRSPAPGRPSSGSPASVPTGLSPGPGGRHHASAAACPRTRGSSTAPACTYLGCAGQPLHHAVAGGSDATSARPFGVTWSGVAVRHRPRSSARRQRHSSPDTRFGGAGCMPG